MKGKKSIAALVTVLAMVLSLVPAFSITADAAAKTQTLFDIENVSFEGTQVDLFGEMTTSDKGVNFNAEWHEDGKYEKNYIGKKALMFCRLQAGGYNAGNEVNTATFVNADQTKGAKRITVEYTFAAQDSTNYQSWEFIDNNDQVFAAVYYDMTKNAAVGTNCGPERTDGVYAGDSSGSKADEVKMLRGTTMKIDAVQNEDGKWSVTYYSNGEQVGEVETIASIDGIASIRGTCWEYNQQYAAMGLMGLKVTYEMPVDLGVTLLDGAQVRYGMGVDETGRVVRDIEGSGLRFIGVVNKEGTLAAEPGASFGVEIKPKDGEEVVIDIPIDKWQNDEKTIFTAVLTNIKVSNYNRVFTATPYVKIGEEKTYGESVSRSIYEVAFGLLKNAETEDAQSDTLPYEVTETMKGVLNAYVNQVGIRLTLAKETGEFEAASDNYVGGKKDNERPDAFFTVTSDASKKDEGIYVVTIKPEEGVTLNNSAEFIKDYIRINNNNSVVKDKIEVVGKDDGSVVITFTYKAA